jgi:hypothetical protein
MAMTKRNVFNNPTIWATNHEPRKITMTEQRQRDEDLRGPLIHIILQDITAFHPDRNKCSREDLIENLKIDFTHNDTNTLVAIAGVLIEQKAIIAKLSESDGKLLDQTITPWSELFPEGRVIYFEGDDQESFVAEIKAKFNFDPSKDSLWRGLAFECPAHLLDDIYGSGKYPMGS